MNSQLAETPQFNETNYFGTDLHEFSYESNYADAQYSIHRVVNDESFPHAYESLPSTSANSFDPQELGSSPPHVSLPSTSTNLTGPQYAGNEESLSTAFSDSHVSLLSTSASSIGPQVFELTTSPISSLSTSTPTTVPREHDCLSDIIHLFTKDEIDAMDRGTFEPNDYNHHRLHMIYMSFKRKNPSHFSHVLPVIPQNAKSKRNRESMKRPYVLSDVDLIDDFIKQRNEAKKKKVEEEEKRKNEEKEKKEEIKRKKMDNLENIKNDRQKEIEEEKSEALGLESEKKAKRGEIKNEKDPDRKRILRQELSEILDLEKILKSKKKDSKEQHRKKMAAVNKNVQNSCPFDLDNNATDDVQENSMNMVQTEENLSDEELVDINW